MFFVKLKNAKNLSKNQILEIMGLYIFVRCQYLETEIRIKIQKNWKNERVSIYKNIEDAVI